ncbi:unnamed protein product [Parnassius apollo]|uniref:(apollo) hypothetical protein n=1 Tax=Parnassius apollo TaxID=110799 RepID=A0A8S3WU84_PARAO|nr:unnamed protein product [Parnassius apollo]
MAGDESDSDLKPSSVAIIREVYDSENAHIKFEMELERALEAGVRVIVIEPEPLGEETARWIYVGNLLHKVSVYSGLCSITSGLIWNSLACAPFGIVSVLCAGCYTLSWQWDPCCKYQEDKNRRRLATLPALSDLTSASPSWFMMSSLLTDRIIEECLEQEDSEEENVSEIEDFEEHSDHESGTEQEASDSDGSSVSEESFPSNLQIENTEDEEYLEDVPLKEEKGRRKDKKEQKMESAEYVDFGDLSEITFSRDGNKEFGIDLENVNPYLIDTDDDDLNIF